TVTVDATTRALSWASNVATKDTRDTTSAGFNTYHDEIRASTFGGTETHTKGDIEYAGTSRTDNTTQKQTIVTGLQFRETTTLTSDNTSTLSDGGSQHTTATSTADSSITVETRVKTDDFSPSLRYTETDINTSHSTDDRTLTGTGGYTSDSV